MQKLWRRIKMFWNDITEMRKEMRYLKRSVDELHCKILNRPLVCSCKSGVITEEHEGEPTSQEHMESMLEQIKETIDDAFCSEEDNSTIDRIHNKLDFLLEDKARLEAVELTGKMLDKFEDYMKNVDKLNGMMNEFKGCVAMARASLQDKKEQDEIREEFKSAIKYMKECVVETRQNREEVRKHSEYALGLHNQHFKIEALYKTLVEDKFIEPKAKPKRVRKPKSEA